MGASPRVYRADCYELPTTPTCFSCAPFLDAIPELENHVDFWKIASYELLSTKLLSSCAAAGTPVIASTGMATLEEVKSAVRDLRQAGVIEMALLHCKFSLPDAAARHQTWQQSIRCAKNVTVWLVGPIAGRACSSPASGSSLGSFYLGVALRFGW